MRIHIYNIGAYKTKIIQLIDGLFKMEMWTYTHLKCTSEKKKKIEGEKESKKMEWKNGDKKVKYINIITLF